MMYIDGSTHPPTEALSKLILFQTFCQTIGIRVLTRYTFQFLQFCRSAVTYIATLRSAKEVAMP